MDVLVDLRSIPAVAACVCGKVSMTLSVFVREYESTD